MTQQHESRKMGQIARMIAVLLAGMIMITIALVVGMMVTAPANHASPTHQIVYTAKGGGNHGHGHH